ncbi:putative nitrite reductase [Azorhizobium caulinodans ORS 571]|uniref:Putative nitrite reductase n=1 Tax=Azorhizobium caulinodans (strain ATCC 43989 / DSM 5975 / JCM 20966 / LMG 6465 / NBRC 14845 / NCIMB 13405 / ORS 571) TaxID=438753 RepID=A8IPS0_AZOC5|nr:FAD-dependent oxidoreductase [Azorhizobium caulinodans]BAF86680.1 putative nitrite reductase [Azorhizobium caulinodans ORS 571]
MSEPLVIIGNGMAATKLCEELGACGLGRYSVAVVGAEPGLAYNRVLLSDVLAGKLPATDLEMKPASWWAKQGVTLLYGTPAASIDRESRAVVLADGRRLPFSRLVLATGSHPIRLPLPGADLPGVTTFRDLADVSALLAAAKPGVRAVVIGGGLLGLEAAIGLAGAGVATTLVHLMDRLMERQLDATAADLLRQAVEARGVTVRLQAHSAAIEGESHVTGLRLADGEVLPADLVVMACGVRPNADLARATGLTCNRGVVVDDHLATSDPAIFALGECAEHRGMAYGLVAPAYEQAHVLARHLAGKPAAYPGSVVSTNLKVSGVPVFSAGDISGEGAQDIVLRDRAHGIYRRLFIRDGVLAGAVLFGDTADGLYFLDLITNRTPIAPLRAALAFGRPALAA